jgi:hypothetical protein
MAMNKLATIKVSGGDYATVPTRLKAFREANPRASITTEPTINGDTIVFKATIKQDQADPNSAEATGHSYGTNTGGKAFERLETVALGRCLAILGYLNNGQIASTEEMEDFEQFKLEKYQAEIDEAESVESLMELFNRMTPEEKKVFTTSVSEKKKELLDADK